MALLNRPRARCLRCGQDAPCSTGGWCLRNTAHACNIQPVQRPARLLEPNGARHALVGLELIVFEAGLAVQLERIESIMGERHALDAVGLARREGQPNRSGMGRI